MTGLLLAQAAEDPGLFLLDNSCPLMVDEVQYEDEEVRNMNHLNTLKKTLLAAGIILLMPIVLSASVFAERRQVEGMALIS